MYRDSLTNLPMCGVLAANGNNDGRLENICCVRVVIHLAYGNTDNQRSTTCSTCVLYGLVELRLGVLHL